jgi:hypothetical protein
VINDILAAPRFETEPAAEAYAAAVKAGQHPPDFGEPLTRGSVT